jgi:hypothetical protein
MGGRPSSGATEKERRFSDNNSPFSPSMELSSLYSDTGPYTCCFVPLVKLNIVANQEEAIVKMLRTKEIWAEEVSGERGLLTEIQCSCRRARIW